MRPARTQRWPTRSPPYGNGRYKRPLICYRLLPGLLGPPATTHQSAKRNLADGRRVVTMHHFTPEQARQICVRLGVTEFKPISPEPVAELMTIVRAEYGLSVPQEPQQTVQLRTHLPGLRQLARQFSHLWQGARLSRRHEKGSGQSISVSPSVCRNS
jgi:hypothetical protein